MPHRIAIVGGTGPEGRGLATRFALGGHGVVLGSRDAERAAVAAAEVASVVTSHAASTGAINGPVTGATNANAVARADVVVIWGNTALAHAVSSLYRRPPLGVELVLVASSGATSVLVALRKHLAARVP